MGAAYMRPFTEFTTNLLVTSPPDRLSGHRAQSAVCSSLRLRRRLVILHLDVGS